MANECGDNIPRADTIVFGVFFIHAMTKGYIEKKRE
jgi:hypothetical protein